MRAYEGLATAIAAETPGPVFALMGDGNFHLLAALAVMGKKIVHARHEAAAVAMADGYYRATGEVGVATVTHGPGLTQVGTSLMAANRNHSKIVLVAGATARRDASGLQHFDQRGFVKATGGTYHELTSPDALVADIRDAFFEARVASTPVVLDASLDVQLAEYTWPWSYEASTAALAPAQRIRPDERMIESVAALIERFERVILVAGRGAADSETANEISSLADETGALLGTTLLARGLFLGHPYDVGTLGAFSSAPTEALLAEAELVVSFGASLNYYTSEGGFLFSDAEVVRIDAAPQGPKIDYGNAMYLQADAYEAAVALRGAIRKRGISPRSGYRTSATDEVLTTPVPDLRQPSEESLKTSVDPRDVMRLLDQALPENVRVICGVGHFWNFFTMYSQPRPETILSYQFGSIGQTLPLAIGAAMADRQRPTLMVEGDGSLMMHLQELDTAARYNLDIVILVMNDSAFGAEVHKLNAYGLDPEPAKIPTPDFSEVARSLGFKKGGVITAAADLQGAIVDAFAAGGPHLFDIRVNPEILADTYLRLHFGEPNQGPRLTPRGPLAR